MAIKNTSIWIKSSTQPTVALPTPRYSMESASFGGSVIRNRPFTPSSANVENTNFFIDIQKNDASLPTPVFQFDFVQTGTGYTDGFLFEDNLIKYVMVNVQGASSRTRWTQAAARWNNVNKATKFEYRWWKLYY